ncbi:hypothetical protein [Colwellia sp. MEBiC06753]
MKKITLTIAAILSLVVSQVQAKTATVAEKATKINNQVYVTIAHNYISEQGTKDLAITLKPQILILNKSQIKVNASANTLMAYASADQKLNVAE